MKIRILRACVTGWATLHPGSVVDMRDTVALDMIHHGLAERVMDEPAITPVAEKPKRKPRRHKCGMQ